MATTQALVTRESLKVMCNNPNPTYVMHVVGRALLVLLANQTADEQASQATLHHNGKGFGGADAEFGTSCAQFYQRCNRLTYGQVRAWTKLGKDGFPRIARYHRQLNAAAIERSTAMKVAA